MPDPSWARKTAEEIWRGIIGCNEDTPETAVHTCQECSVESCFKDIEKSAAVILRCAEKRWIPVAEKNPDSERMILLTGGKHVHMRSFMEGQYMFIDINRFWDSALGWVTHWMELPTPPKEDICNAAADNQPSA